MKDTVILSWGRMNPPTIGHEKLIMTMKELSKTHNATPLVFLSHSKDKRKNPLSYDKKFAYAKKAFGNIVQRSQARTIIQVLKSLSEKYSSLIMVVGSDRIEEFEKLLSDYNNKEYSFANIQVISCGHRDPDSDGVEAISASKMRDYVALGDLGAFNSGLPTNLKNNREIFKDIQEELDVRRKI